MRYMFGFHPLVLYSRKALYQVMHLFLDVLFIEIFGRLNRVPIQLVSLLLLELLGSVS